MKKLTLLAGVSLLALVGAARADTIDPLHGEVCATSTTCSGAEVGSHTLMPTNTGFGFAVSPSGTGTLELLILTPNNDGAEVDTLSGTGLTAGGVGLGTSLGVWSTGSLATFLGLSASPDNPIGAYLPSAQALDPGATGFNVYAVFDPMSMTLPTEQGTLPDEFRLSGALPIGSFITGFFNEGVNGEVATANSGALFVNTTAVQATPIPGALPMFIGGLGLLGLMGKRRKQKQAASVFA